MAVYKLSKHFDDSLSLCHVATLREAEMVIQMSNQIQRGSISLPRVEGIGFKLNLWALSSVFFLLSILFLSPVHRQPQGEAELRECCGEIPIKPAGTGAEELPAGQQAERAGSYPWGMMLAMEWVSTSSGGIGRLP